MNADASENENSATEFTLDSDSAESSVSQEAEGENVAHEFSTETADEEAAVEEFDAPVQDQGMCLPINPPPNQRELS